ncbi:GNAT family N-acetyltransferase [Cohnella sp. WQ 127256]|uniref:GNAT family N-acetyltransferase n=1 Tax=Cohnella sp. WQ 127256 TaxID=2938790 RepID=UPI002740A85F|nr:GNAT family N-acetyltransferase [Cohnella sp. WQ 127256]
MMRVVRVESVDQLRQALDIRLEVFVQEQGVSPDLEVDEYDESPAASYHFIVLDEEQPIAAGRIKTYEAGVAKMQRIAVRAAYRGLGVGKLLMQGMEEAAKQIGYEAAVLDAQCTAEAFYNKLGYATESVTPFLDAGILHVRMRKSLSSNN